MRNIETIHLKLQYKIILKKKKEKKTSKYNMFINPDSLQVRVREMTV